MKLRLFLATSILLFCGFGAVNAQVIIVNPSVKVTEIKKNELRDIFMGASSNFADGSRAVPGTLKSGPVHETFLKAYIGKSDTAFRAVWRALLFSGQAILPQAFDEEAALIDYVAKVPGAIGYVANPTKHDKVKLLTVR